MSSFASAPNASLAAAPPVDFFGGFDAWLEFRAAAAMARVTASFSDPDDPTRALPLRAKLISKQPGGDELWALCDGERAPLPFLCSTLDRYGSWATAGSSWIHGDPYQDDDGDFAYPEEDGLLQAIVSKLKAARDANPDARLADFVIESKGPLLHAPFSEPAYDWENDGMEVIETPRENARREALPDAWARLLSEPAGHAALHPLWRELQGERRVAIAFSARALTSLSIYDHDPEAEPDCNLWGQSERDDTEYWLIEPEGAGEPFLFERSTWQRPYHQLDEVRHGSHLSAKGQSVWSESWDMDSGSASPDNLFTEIVQRLPPIDQHGFDFVPGEPVRIELAPLFENDARPWLDILELKAEHGEDSVSPALLAMCEAASLKSACSRPAADSGANPAPARGPALRV